MGTPGANRPDQGDATRLWNLAPPHPRQTKCASRMYHGRGELIDHILVNHALLDRIDHIEVLTDRELPSIGDDPADRRRARDSDHAPGLAHLNP